MGRRQAVGGSEGSFLALVVACALAGCASGDAGRPAARGPSDSRMETAPPDAEASARAIDAIIYSELSREEMLGKLKPFVALMDSTDDFRRKTGIELRGGYGTGPGVLTYRVPGSGLSLVFDPDRNIRVIRRAARTVGGREYPQMSISEQGFEWKGYRRRYPD
jgi:hypothetical protein